VAADIGVVVEVIGEGLTLPQIFEASANLRRASDATEANGGRTRDRTLDLSRVKGTLSR
jgi:hypothetical protein